MKKFTFKGYKADSDAAKGSPEQKDPPREPLNPQQRRREQVRRAQKTHRERKEAYVASLETEVVNLRANETRILQETKALYAELRALKKILADNGIPLPPSLQDATLQFSQLDIQQPQPASNIPTEPSFTLNIGQEKKGWHRRKQIYIQKTAPPNQPEQGLEHQMGFLANPTQPSSAGEGPSPLSAALLSPDSSTISLRLGDLDPTVVGMDFVLSLESPCLSHLDTADTWNAPTTSGHTLTVSASLLQYHPGPRGKRLNSPVAWQVPSTNIERLLELSRAIPLDEGELTPVQAWDYIRKQAQYAVVEMERWEKLKEKLVGRIKCHGFGAVLDRDAFEDAVYETFVAGRVI